MNVKGYLYVFIFTAWLMLLVCCCDLCAADVTLAWDAKVYAPDEAIWEKVRIYERTYLDSGDYTYALVAEVEGAETQATIADVSAGRHCYVARAFVKEVESENSNMAEVVIGGEMPLPPKGFSITITVSP